MPQIKDLSNKATIVNTDMIPLQTVDGVTKHAQAGILLDKIQDVEDSISNVTNDAQLKRAADDFSTFPQKSGLSDADIVLIEDSDAGFAKKKATVQEIKSTTQASITSNTDKINQTLLQHAIQLAYLQGRKSIYTDFLLELFQDEKDIDYSEDGSNNFAKVMWETDFNNNWIFREDGNPDFKNGFLRPRSQNYMMEVIDEYDLNLLGQAYKSAISNYDEKNDCYWLMTNAGANAIGEILQLDSAMGNGKVTIRRRWYLAAGGASTQWTGIASDGDRLYFSLWKSAGSIVYGIAINSDGTLGATGYKKSSGDVIDLTNSIYTSYTNDTASSYIVDISDYSETEICYMLCATTTVTVGFLLKSDLTTGTSGPITVFGPFLGGSTSVNRAFNYKDGVFYTKGNDATDDIRRIVLFNEDGFITTSTGRFVVENNGRFTTARDVDESATSCCGIAIDKYGDVLEVVSTTSNGNFIAKRALKNALWAEGQVSREYFMNGTVSPTQKDLRKLQSCCYHNNYLYTASAPASSRGVYVYRHDILTGAKHSVRLEGLTRLWASCFGIAIVDNTIYLLGTDLTNYEVVFGSLSSLNTALELASDYSDANAISIENADGVFTLATGIDSVNTKALYGICYDSDAGVLLLLNDTDDKIDTLSLDGATWTKGVYDLPAPTNTWRDIAYKDGKIYVRDFTNGTTPNRVYVIDKSKSTADSWYREHIYQDQFNIGGYVAEGATGISFYNDEMINVSMYAYGGDTYVNINKRFFTFQKTLHDPNVLQLHSFLDTNNVLLSNNVSCQTPIVDRYFNPEDFTYPEDVPDKKYMVVGYGDNGFSELHLDEAFYCTSTGLSRFDVSKVRTRHYIQGATNILYDATATTSCVAIERDMIFVGDIAGYVKIVDLKAGTCQILYTGTSSGFRYGGTLSERNDGKNYSGTLNAELNISNAAQRRLHAITFTKSDQSDYYHPNPKTFVTIGTDGGNDILVIDWDSNNNRTPVKVWNNVINDASYGQYACWIAPSGTLFLTDNVITTGPTSKLTIPIWELNAEGATSAALFSAIGTNLLASAGYDISPNSRCWKTPSGTWRHQLIITSSDLTASTFPIKTAIIDVENATIEVIFSQASSTTPTGAMMADVFEDTIFAHHVYSTTRAEFMLFKKNRFDDLKSTENYNKWTTYNPTTIINLSSNPYFTPNLAVTALMMTHTKYSYNKNVAGLTYNGFGLQFFHFPNALSSYIKSITYDCDSPEYAHVYNSIYNPQTYKVTTIPYTATSDIVYTDGNDQSWGVSGGLMQIGKSSLTQGYVTIENITELDGYGINFYRGANDGGVKITLTKKGTPDVVDSYWDQKQVQLYTTIEGEYNTIWLSLDNRYTYELKIEHNGVNYAGDDYVRIKNYYEVLNISCDVKHNMTLYHTDYPSIVYNFELDNNTRNEFEHIESIVSEESDTTYTITAGRAYYPTRFGFKPSGGSITWYDITSDNLTWGGNPPDYNNNLVGTDGIFGVVFSEAPGEGTVYIAYTPLSNKFWAKTTMTAPHDDYYYDAQHNYRLTDYAIEAE